MHGLWGNLCHDISIACDDVHASSREYPVPSKPITDSDLKARRIAAVRHHMEMEIVQDWDAVLATFEHPRYELRGHGAVFDGDEAVRRYLTRSRIPFPDQGNEVIAIAADDVDTVFVEFWLTGTHLGPLKVGTETVAPTGKSFRVRLAATFEFATGSDKIVCERPYYDRFALIHALGLRSES